MTTETFIHPSAVVEPGAQLGDGAHVGPFCHVGPDAVIGDRVRMVGHVTVLGATTIGSDCRIWPNAVLGGNPQSVRHKGGRTTLTVGPNCEIREGVTFNLGTDTSRGETSIGSNGYFMALSHVAHDCVVGNNVTMANATALGGHGEIGDFVTIGALAAIHQFVRVGHHAFIGGYAAVVGDVIPYGMAVGDRAKLRGLNVIGIKRSGYSRPELMEMRAAYKMLFAPGRTLADAIPLVEAEYGRAPAVADILSFLRARGKRHFTVPAMSDRGVDFDDGA